MSPFLPFLFLSRLRRPLRSSRLLRGLLALLVLLPALATAAGPFDAGLLWRVERAGYPPAFLFGTVHVDDPRVTRLPEAVTRRFDAAGEFTMEVIFDPAMLKTLAGRMLYADGRDLPQVAGAELFGKAAAAAGDLGLPPEALRLFRPWAVAMLLIMPRQQHGDVLDVMLMKRAQEQGKPVHQLETVDEQIALFENLPERDQLMMLRHTVDNLETARRGVRDVVEAWLARDLAALARISDRADISDPEMRRFNERFRAELIDGRNLRMVERMQPRLQAGGFIAVGALHLHGARGVLAELAALGYVVTREY
jgi:uncharacterized protein YbaP (TraB family)